MCTIVCVCARMCNCMGMSTRMCTGTRGHACHAHVQMHGWTGQQTDEEMFACDIRTGGHVCRLVYGQIQHVYRHVCRRTRCPSSCYPRYDRGRTLAPACMRALYCVVLRCVALCVHMLRAHATRPRPRQTRASTCASTCACTSAHTCSRHVYRSPIADCRPGGAGGARFLICTWQAVSASKPPW